ncbi:MAG TPA: riboflavin biosynthesis protein RibF [Lachnospiraceae bacterium]|nr:riboflavin biosynthesis protein RibF [Lachnospiraceae bacterium]
MQCISKLEEYQDGCLTAMTLGKFDGLHRGHQQLVDRICAYAKEEEALKSVVFVFDMASFFEKQNIVRKTLMTKEERRYQLEGKIDYLVECPFTDAIRTMEAEDFIRDILVGLFHVRYLVVGTDYSFGYQKRGNYEMLLQYADTYGYHVDVIEKLKYEEREISSTFIREDVEAGNMKRAAVLLGHPYQLMGRISHGRQLGRTIGIPTMNVPVRKEKLLPPNGVYAARGILEGVSYDGILNIGRKPTVEENGEVLAELHLFDYAQEAYGKEIEIEIYEFERPEQRFASIEALQKRIQQDIAYGKQYFQNER